jgi:hypothetical protein
MIADRRSLQLIFLFAGLVLASAPIFSRATPPPAVSLQGSGRVLGSPCALSYRAVGEEPKPPVLTRHEPEEYDDMGNLTALAEAAKVTDLKRLKPATLVADLADPSSSKVLANLDDGIYVYGIDSSNHLVMMPRTMIAPSELLANPDAQSLGSHAGLMLVPQDKFGPNAGFVSTGEFVRRNGRVFSVDNKSGTFPGGSDSLQYGIKKLKSAGLEIESGKTKIADASKYETSGAHDVAYRQVKIEAKVMADPVRRQLYEEARRIMKKADGKFDQTSVAVFLPSSMSENVRRNAGYFYDRWQLPSEGTAYIFEDVFSGRFAEDPAAFRKMLKEVEKAADAKN